MGIDWFMGCSLRIYSYVAGMGVGVRLGAEMRAWDVSLRSWLGGWRRKEGVSLSKKVSFLLGSAVRE